MFVVYKFALHGQQFPCQTGKGNRMKHLQLWAGPDCVEDDLHWDCFLSDNAVLELGDNAQTWVSSMPPVVLPQLLIWRSCGFSWLHLLDRILFGTSFSLFSSSISLFSTSFCYMYVRCLLFFVRYFSVLIGASLLALHKNTDFRCSTRFTQNSLCYLFLL